MDLMIYPVMVYKWGCWNYGDIEVLTEGNNHGDKIHLIRF